MTTRNGNPDAPGALRDAIVWLQEQMTQVRDEIVRLQRDTDDSLGRLSILFERLDDAQERLTRQDRSLEVVAELQQEVRQAWETAAQLRERFTGFELRLQEYDRQRDMAAEREQEARAELTRRIDEVSRSVQPLEGRVNILDDAQKQVQDALLQLRQATEAAENTARMAESHTVILSDTTHRLEAKGSLLDTRIEEIQRSIDAITDRLQLTIAHGQRLERQMDTVIAERLNNIGDTAEQVEVLKAERARMETTLQGLEARVDSADTAAREQQAIIIRLQGRSQSMDERLRQLDTKIDNLSEQVVAQIVRFGQTQERQKRRQVEDLEREIRELKEYARRIAEE